MKNIEQKVIKFIDRHELITPGDKLLIALSGGPDSVFLLHFLEKYKKRFKIMLVAVHVNHQLRGEESDQDEKFCEELCDDLGIKFYSSSIDVQSYAAEHKLSIEEAGRDLRYLEFQKTADMCGASKITTAHNLDDNTETVLLNLFKGTGVSGIAGIPIKRDNIIRPLLNLEKELILKYLSHAGFEYRIDNTNLSREFNRNYLRNEIIPDLKKNLNPSLDEAVYRSSEVFRGITKVIDEMVEQLSENFVKFSNNELIFDISIVNKYGEYVFGEALKKSLRKHFSHDFDFDDFMKLNSLLNKHAGKKIQLSQKLIAVRDREKISIMEEHISKIDEPIEIRPGQEVKIFDKYYRIEISSEDVKEYNSKKNYEIISAENLDGMFTLRRWKAGDKFIPLGMKEYKKISDFLSEQKVPPSIKKNQIVLQNRNNIVWVAGLRIDDRFKVTPETKKVCKIWMQ